MFRAFYLCLLAIGLTNSALMAVLHGSRILRMDFTGFDVLGFVLFSVVVFVMKVWIVEAWEENSEAV